MVVNSVGYFNSIHCRWSSKLRHPIVHWMRIEQHFLRSKYVNITCNLKSNFFHLSTAIMALVDGCYLNEWFPLYVFSWELVLRSKFPVILVNQSLFSFSFFDINLQMEGIPSKVRNLQMNLMMGKLYRNSRHTRASVTCYKECLRLFTLNCSFLLNFRV